MDDLLGDITFDEALGNYGDSTSALDKEIRRDLLREIVTTVGTRPFARSDGLGLDYLENETNAALQYTIYKFMVTSAVTRYNAKVTSDRQVITSQRFINIKEGNQPGEMLIDIYYIARKDLGSASASDVRRVSLGGI